MGQNNVLDLIGKRFGRLVVLERAEDKIDPKSGKHKSYFLCQCDCGNQKIILGTNLTSGATRSCGCLHNEISSITAKKKKGKKLLSNIYDLTTHEYGIGYTIKGEEFYFDKEDYELIKDICWYKDTRGYIVGHYQGRQIRMHRLIMGVLDNSKVIVDHKIPMSHYDNRKHNLRITIQQNNCRNRSVNLNSKTGVTGVTKTRNGTYFAYIGYNHELKRLGTYKTLEEAAIIRRVAELAYFGEYAVKNGFNRKDGKQCKEFIRHGIFHTF